MWRNTALSKETKMVKKEQKAAKKAAKLEKRQAAQYAALVKKIDKKNAKIEKKANKKNKPFVPIPVPTMEEAFAAAPSKGKTALKVIKMIILILLIVFLVYFAYMYFMYVAPTVKMEEETTEPAGVAQEYDRYENKHEITTTPTYSVSEAKDFLKQVLHDNWRVLNYKSDPSGNSINSTGQKVTVNNQDCYVFSVGGRTYAVSVRLSSVYEKNGNEYTPLTFHNTDKLNF